MQKFSETGVSYGFLEDPDAGNPFVHRNDIIYIRYADVLLMLAEALNENRKDINPLPYLNEVHKRENLVDITDSDQSTPRDII